MPEQPQIRNAPLPIQDYALIGDCRTAAIVGRDGGIDWLCLPQFDSPACFAALLGEADNGSWTIGPCVAGAQIRRSYRGPSLVLETVFTTPEGEVALIDAMPLGQEGSHIVRRVEGRSGRMKMRLHAKIRFDFGVSVPWVTADEDGRGIMAVIGPDLITLHGPVPLEGHDMATRAEFEVAQGQSLTFVMSHGSSTKPPPARLDGDAALADTEAKWCDWSHRSTYDGSYKDAVNRSLLVLKALTFEPTGGIVAAPTTSLPEQLGGGRNWDYRFCWLRDATLTLRALMGGGYMDEAKAWGDWLQRSIAGSASQLQIMYSVDSLRQLQEWEVGWLAGYEGAKPVRVGNAASGQLQLDVFGEVMDAMHMARSGGLAISPSVWDMQLHLMEYLESIWQQPDDGIWEVRGGRKHFVHSKVMAWVAFDRTIKDMEQHGQQGPLERWRGVRDAIHADVCAKGFDTAQNSFTQSYGSKSLDASVLLLSAVGFLPPRDPRILGTVAAIERGLMENGFLLRYRTEEGADGLKPGEGAFLPCTFWLANCYVQQGRLADARTLFEHLLTFRNDLGLLSEEYDTHARRLVGNFPQAFSHLALIETALNLHEAHAAQKPTAGAGS